MADDDFGDADLWAAIDNAAAARYGRPAPVNPVVSDRSLVVSRFQQSPAPLVELPPSPQTAVAVASRIGAQKENVTIGQKRQQVHFVDERAPVRQKHNHQRFPAGRSPLQQIPCTEMVSHDVPSIDNATNQWMNGVGFPSTAVFRHLQDAAMGILDKGDYVMMQGKPFIKKCGWRKIAFFFNISFEIKDRKIDLDQSANVMRAEFIVRATMQSGRFSDGWGSCDVREKRFSKPNHDIPSTAETRAKTRACQDLLGIGEMKTNAEKWLWICNACLFVKQFCTALLCGDNMQHLAVRIARLPRSLKSFPLREGRSTVFNPYVAARCFHDDVPSVRIEKGDLNKAIINLGSLTPIVTELNELDENKRLRYAKATKSILELSKFMVDLSKTVVKKSQTEVLEELVEKKFEDVTLRIEEKFEELIEEKFEDVTLRIEEKFEELIEKKFEELIEEKFEDVTLRIEEKSEELIEEKFEDVTLRTEEKFEELIEKKFEELIEEKFEDVTLRIEEKFEELIEKKFEELIEEKFEDVTLRIEEKFEELFEEKFEDVNLRIEEKFKDMTPRTEELKESSSEEDSYTSYTDASSEEDNEEEGPSKREFADSMHTVGNLLTEQKNDVKLGKKKWTRC